VNGLPHTFHSRYPSLVVVCLRIVANNYEYATGYVAQTKLIIGRQFTELLRNLPALKTMLSSQIMIGLMLGSLFWQLGVAQADARTRFGFIFFCLSFAASVSSFLIPGHLKFRPIYYVQERSGYYHGIAYHMGRLGILNNHLQMFPSISYLVIFNTLYFCCLL
jgi:hypothetical protein